MRVAFAGTPEAAIPTLDALVAAGYDVAVVLTREDAPLGRKRVLTPSPVAARAAELGLRVVKANRITEEVARELLNTGFELGVVVAYGGIIRTPLLDQPRHGWINLHFSQLPRWRGAAPVQRAIMAGDRHSGIAVFQLEAGLDTGPTYVNRAVEIGAAETAGELLGRLAHEGADDVVEVVSAIAAGTASATPQTGQPVTAAKLTVTDGIIDWARPATEIDAQVRGVTLEPGAATVLNGQRYKVLRGTPQPDTLELAPGTVQLLHKHAIVACAVGSYRLEQVQPAGKKPMAAVDWLRGQHGQVRFG